MRCRFSHLKYASQPVRALNSRDVATGVRCATPSRMRAAASTSAYPGNPATLLQGDLAVEAHVERHAVHDEGHLRRERLAPLELAGGNGAFHGAFDLALRMDADLLQELADAHVECVGIHALRLL